jgi:hypothetical protein
MKTLTLLRASLMGAAVVLVTGIGLPNAGQAASLTFTLADCNNGAGCSPQTGNNFGTVTITDVVANVVSVDVDLSNSFTWAKTGLIGFAFNLVAGFTGMNTPQLSNVTATNWTPTSGSPLTNFNSDGMGSAQYGLDFTGANNSVTANLDFRLTATGLDVTDFTTGGTAADTGKQYFFLADLCTKALPGGCSESGGTGLVGAVAAPVPGPIVGAGAPGLMAACAGLIALARRRRQKIV